MVQKLHAWGLKQNVLLKKNKKNNSLGDSETLTICKH